MIKIWALYITLFFPILFFSQNQLEEFDIKKDSLLPGTTTSIAFRIENISLKNKTFDITVNTSSHYIKPILGESEIVLEPNETRTYLIALKIATETPQGHYTLSLKGIDKNGQIQLSKTKEIIISGNRKISVSSLDTPEFIKAGETIKSTFLLKNSGNVTENLILESKNAGINEGSSINLLPGETKIVTVTKDTNPDLGKNEYINLNLSVYSADNLKENQTAYTSVKVISVKPTEDDIYHRLPIFASLSFIGMRNRGNYNDGFQGEIYGKGSLNKDNKGLLEFRAVTSNPVEFNTFTQYEEYFINYKTKNFFVHLGDKTYSSSYLTEFARYGRGAELSYNFGKISVGGFYNHPRFFRDIKDEFNVYSKYQLNNESEITAGYLYKIPRPEEISFSFNNVKLDSDAHLPYVSGRFKINNNINVLGELSYSKTDKTEGNAYMIQATGSFKKLNGNVMYTRASPQFAGYFTNTDNFNGNLQYKISEKINLFTNYVQDARNFQRDTLFLAAPYRKFLQYGITYRYIKSGNITFHSGFQKYEDRLEPKQFDYFERYFKISLEQQLGAFQLNLESQFGRTDNYLTGFRGNSNFYTANLSFEKFRTSFNFYGSYAITSRYQMQNNKQIYYGARIFSRFSEKTSISVFYQNNYLPEEYFNDRNLFELLFHQQLFPGHQFDVSGRYTLQRGELGNKDFIFSLRYTLQLNAPIKKIAEYTVLSGNISNLGIKKTEGIRLMLGNHLSVTDKNGNFIFKNVVPGDYFLEIDRSTLEINDIPDIPFPASLNLNDKDNIFNFGITEAAKIQGQIFFKENEDNKNVAFATQTKKDKKKKESLIVEASHGKQTYRKICNIGEKFDFTYLRPGEWNVKIYRNGLDKRYKISIDHFKLNLNPSETKNISINVTKQQTEIKYQQEAIKVSYNELKK